MGNLIGITLNLLTALGSMVILMILIQSKSMGYLSISLNQLQFALVMFFSSQHSSQQVFHLLGEVYS